MRRPRHPSYRLLNFVTEPRTSLKRAPSLPSRSRTGESQRVPISACVQFLSLVRYWLTPAQDVLTKVALLFDYLSGAEKQFAEHDASFR